MKYLFYAFLLVSLASCTNINKTMKSPNTLVELEREDFKLSSQVSASATTTRILLIDWKRLRSKKSGAVEASGPAGAINFASIPVIGNVLMDPTQNYALYNLMSENPGYDVVFYPQYETTVERPILGLGFFKTVTTVKATARLGSIE